MKLAILRLTRKCNFIPLRRDTLLQRSRIMWLNFEASFKNNCARARAVNGFTLLRFSLGPLLSLFPVGADPIEKAEDRLRESRLVASSGVWPRFLLRVCGMYNGALLCYIS